jgi:hypothetical protein
MPENYKGEARRRGCLGLHFLHMSTGPQTIRNTTGKDSLPGLVNYRERPIDGSLSRTFQNIFRRYGIPRYGNPILSDSSGFGAGIDDALRSARRASPARLRAT